MAKNNSELKGVQKKLVAAVAMVLVACIMVVSSSYAWFTLSTAPEVKGIQTSVGSNGNLEMALITTGLGDIGTTGDKTEFPLANNFWGNLVNLSDGSYNLSAISLAPARLNTSRVPNGYTYAQVTINDITDQSLYQEGGTVKVDGVDYVINEITWTGDAAPYSALITYQVPEYTYTVDGTSYLKTAEYGTDGRVSGLRANTYAGTYDVVDGLGAFRQNGKFGVRAIGTSSGLTPEQIALRDAVALVSSAKNIAKGLAVQSLTDDSVKLASLLVDNKLNNTTSVSREQLDQVVAAVANLQNVVDTLKEATDATVIAVGVSQKKTITAADIQFAKTGDEITDFTAGTVDFSALTSLKTELIGAYETLRLMQADLDGAKGTLDDAIEDDADGPYTYDAVVIPAMTAILSTSHMKLDGTPISSNQTALQNAVFDAIMKYGYLPIDIVGGIYQNIALFVENYAADTEMTVTSAKLAQIAGSETMTAKVKMVTKATAPVNETSFYLPYFVIAISSLTVSGENTGAVVISDYYAYAIDLAFRTNAANSMLRLQTSAISRVGDDTSSAVQGAGSYMQFGLSANAATNGYSVKQMVELMKAIRVVLMDHATGEIYGVAVLNVGLEYVDNSDEDGIQYVEATGADILTDVVVVDGQEKTVQMQLTAGELVGNQIKAGLYLTDFTIDSEGKITIPENGKGLITEQSQADIMALPQNTAVGLTSLVFLDGDVVDNGDVAINGDSMTGTMNLQFSSSAQLEPMDYTFQTEPKLDAPTDVQITGEGVLNFTPAANATSYEIYVNGTATGKTVDASGTNLTTALSGYDIGSAAGTQVSITLVAKAEGYQNSDPSTAAQYTIPTPTP